MGVSGFAQMTATRESGKPSRPVRRRRFLTCWRPDPRSMRAQSPASQPEHFPTSIGAQARLQWSVSITVHEQTQWQLHKRTVPVRH